MPWLSTWSGPGVDQGPPTTTGTPIASAAAWSPLCTGPGTNGSTAVEFSGHSTKSGCGCLPGADVVGQVDGRLDMVGGELVGVVEDVVAPRRARCPARPRPSPSSSPRGDTAASAGSATAARRGPATDARGDQPIGSGRAGERPAGRAGTRPARAGRSGRSKPTYGQRLGDWGVDDPEGEPPERHPAERPAAAGDLHGRPGGGQPDGPPRQPLQDGRGGTQSGVERAPRRWTCRSRRPCRWTPRIQ